jgi:ribosomal protein S18 acetylase RimI-like enzyme
MEVRHRQPRWARPDRSPLRRADPDTRQVARSLASFIEAFRRVARTSDRGWIEERDHVVSVATGMPVAAFNPTFVVAAVGTAMTCCIDGVALIFNVATRPNHRRRGIGEAMTWWAVNHGIEAGCDLAFLQASPDGLPLYERMGFRHVMEMATWSLA